LLIVDFAPHELEFCRSELAHRRLGFSDLEVQGWFRASGLEAASAESIAPDRADKLTVKIWTATSVRKPARARAREAA